MEANCEELREEKNNEIRIKMPIVEDNTIKLHHSLKIGSIQTLKTSIQEDPGIIVQALLEKNTLMSRRIEMLEYLLSRRTRKSSIIRRTRRARSIRTSSREYSNTRTRGWWQIWKKNLKYKGDWLQDVQGTLMLVATVIATVAFQGAIDPPGGVWQEDHGLEGEAGVAIMAYKSLKIYRGYLIANSISFLASVSVILLIVSGFPSRNRIFGGLLKLAMCVAVAFLTFAYINGTAMVSGNQTTQKYLLVLLRVWYGMVGLVILCCIIIPSLVWLLKNFIPTL